LKLLLKKLQRYFENSFRKILPNDTLKVDFFLSNVFLKVLSFLFKWFTKNSYQNFYKIVYLKLTTLKLVIKNFTEWYFETNI